MNEEPKIETVKIRLTKSKKKRDLDDESEEALLERLTRLQERHKDLMENDPYYASLNATLPNDFHSGIPLNAPVVSKAMSDLNECFKYGNWQAAMKNTTELRNIKWRLESHNKRVKKENDRLTKQAEDEARFAEKMNKGDK